MSTLGQFRCYVEPWFVLTVGLFFCFFLVCVCVEKPELVLHTITKFWFILSHTGCLGFPLTASAPRQLGHEISVLLVS